MIAKLTENLKYFVQSVGEYIEDYSENSFYYSFHGKGSVTEWQNTLARTVNEFECNREILYKELFEEWCKVDIYRLCRLFNQFTALHNLWGKVIWEQFDTLGFFIEFELLPIYDEIKLRRPDIIKDIEAEGMVADTEAELPDGIKLPDELNTPEANKYFARAVKVGYIKKTATGYKWDRALTRLGYFCSKAYTQPRPVSALETYFGVKNLAASITQASFECKRADVMRWRSEIDATIFYD